MQIFVKSLSSKTIVIDVNPIFDTLLNIRTKIEDREGIPVHLQRLQCEGTFLDNNSKTLNDYLFPRNIQNCTAKNDANDPSKEYTLHLSLPILGGKGGFGTLLKGQSKQAGARKTLDFGACRDLNGRRLRHVNDAIKVRKWRETQRRREEEGDDYTIDDEIQDMRTPSGIRNWHLMVPNWSEASADTSGKGRRKVELGLRREAERLDREKDLKHFKTLQDKEMFERSVNQYANEGISDKGNVEDSYDIMSDAIYYGMRKRRKLVNDDKSDNDNHNQEYSKQTPILDHPKQQLVSQCNLVTLSGDFLVEEENVEPNALNQEHDYVMIQSKSEFSTACFLFPTPSTLPKAIYYEILIQSGGLAQVGYASLNIHSDTMSTIHNGKGFLPNTDTGDGVGDDAWSFGFDGYRGLTFHNGKESKVNSSIEHDTKIEGGNSRTNSPWKNGDIVGCLFDTESMTISFSINDSGGISSRSSSRSSSPIKTMDKTLSTMKVNSSSIIQYAEGTSLLYPALSLNKDEILGINIGPNFQYGPKSNKYVSVHDLIHNPKSMLQDSIAVESEESLFTSQVKVDVQRKESETEMEPSLSQDTNRNDVPHTLIKETEDSIPEQALATSKSSPVHSSQPLILENIQSTYELEKLGMETLKQELLQRGCKCGGSISERAKRLFSLKGLKRDEYPIKARGKNFNLF